LGLARDRGRLLPADEGRIDKPPLTSVSRAMTERSVTFFFPYREVSGVPVLFARMAEYLAGRPPGGPAVSIVDYPDGCMATRLANDRRINFVPFHDGLPLEVPGDTTLVMQSILPYTMRPELRINRAANLIFWTLYPFNLVPTLVPTKWCRDFQAKHEGLNRLVMTTIGSRLRTQLAATILGLASKQSLWFMDGTTLSSTTHRLGIDLPNPVYMPVPCTDPLTPPPTRRLRAGNSALTVAWLGRLADFKTPILIHTIEQLAAYARRRRRKVRVLIVGDGPDRSRVLQAIPSGGFVSADCLGVVTGSALEDVLVAETDLLVAMGASALEGAKLGIPTLLLDVCYGRVARDYRFKWLHEVANHSLGEVLGPRSSSLGAHSLEEAIDEIDTNALTLSQRTLRYFNENHSMRVVGERFVSHIARASFRVGDFPPRVLQKTVLRRAYELARAAYRKARGTPSNATNHA
jgi:hypothetical protein